MFLSIQQNLKYFSYGVISILLVSCGARQEGDASWAESAADSTMFTSTAAVHNPKDTTHAFIRTGEIKCRVKSVYQSAIHIEKIAVQMGGYVATSEISNENKYQTETPISADSTLESITYTTIGNITIRVPVQNLDSTLRAIGPHIDFLDYRKISADDVKLSLLMNELAQKRARQPIEEEVISIKGKDSSIIERKKTKLPSAYDQSLADEAKIANLKLKKDMAFSTVTIYLYQRSDTKRWKVVNEKNIRSFEPGFTSQLWDAVVFGWTIVQSIIIFLTKIWGIVLLLILSWFGFKWIKSKNWF
ncbi:MAG: DUF4349 domain-containing protein [Cytophagaceae bacterium]|jgi:hypothetical protein|nr:DUF4349 domain-containing protein [Cytophagaceae bacterium]